MYIPELMWLTKCRTEVNSHVSVDTHTDHLILLLISVSHQINAVRAVVPNKSNNEIALVLQHFENSVDRAVQAFVEGTTPFTAQFPYVCLGADAGLVPWMSIDAFLFFCFFLGKLFLDLSWLAVVSVYMFISHSHRQLECVSGILTMNACSKMPQF